VVYISECRICGYLYKVSSRMGTSTIFHGRRKSGNKEEAANHFGGTRLGGTRLGGTSPRFNGETRSLRRDSPKKNKIQESCVKYSSALLCFSDPAKPPCQFSSCQENELTPTLKRSHFLPFVFYLLSPKAERGKGNLSHNRCGCSLQPRGEARHGDSRKGRYRSEAQRPLRNICLWIC